VAAIDEHLCDLEGQGFIDRQFKDYKKLVRYGRFVFRDCGRVARKKQNLCNPKRLYKGRGK
jgi:hypothetical protein